VRVIADRPAAALIADSASAEEAAAIAAALARFAQDTATAPADAGERQDGWARAALLEGVSRQAHAGTVHPWINT
jgi:hypothetical protein